MPTIKATDLDIHYIEHGTGRPIIFIHGNWATAAWWELVLARLPPGLRGIAYDLRGRGQTNGPDSTYAIPALADDLAAFIDALDLPTCDLVGHSLGSAIAMHYALEHPERTRTLTVVAPAWVDGMPPAYNLPDDQRAVKADPVRFAQRLKLLAPSAPDDPFWQRLVEEGHRQRLTATLCNLPMLVAWQPGDHLRTITAPKLVICGALDLLTGGANAERAAAALDATLIVMPGVGHSPLIEAPDAFMTLLVTHLSKG